MVFLEATLTIRSLSPTGSRRRTRHAGGVRSSRPTAGSFVEADFFEQRLELRFVALRERAVADHVSEHYRGELAMFGAGAHFTRFIFRRMAWTRGCGRSSFQTG